MVPFWTAVSGEGLAQGDFLVQCLIPFVTRDFGLNGSTARMKSRFECLTLSS